MADEHDPSSDTGSEEPGLPAPADSETEPVVGEGVPAVAVVLPTDGNGSHARCLESLVALNYSNLTIVVIGPDRDGFAAEVAAVAPQAFVRASHRIRTFGEAANVALDVVEGAAFLLFVHDDVELAPDALALMVNNAFALNSGVVGAKELEADRPDRLLSVGVGADRFGHPAPLVEPGELDQGQHDGVQLVFAVSSAAMLVRADLFADIGGFDALLQSPAADLDLCWRAQIAGALVVVMPLARCFHAQTSTFADSSWPEHDIIHSAPRIILTNWGLWSLLRVLPLAALLSVFDFVGSLALGRTSRARSVASAWVATLAHLPSTLRRRRKVQKARRLSDREIRSRMEPGGVRLRESLGALRRRAMNRVPDPAAISRFRRAGSVEQSRASELTLGVALLLGWLIGSRELISGGVPVVREFVSFHELGAGWSAWWSGATAGTATGSSTMLQPLVWLLHQASLGHDGLLRTALILWLLPAGWLGAWRLLAGVASVRSRIVVTATWAILPVAPQALGAGRWSVLAVYAALPWLVAGILRRSGIGPWRELTAAGGAPWGAWLIIGVASALAPSIAILVLVFGVIASVVALASGERSGAGRCLAVTTLIALGAVALNAGVWVAVLTSPQRWVILWGAPDAGGLMLSDVVRSSSEVGAGGLLWFAVPLAAALVLLVGRGWRLQIGAICWLAATACWATVLLSQRFDVMGRPPAGPLLSLAGLLLAVAVGLGVEAFGSDVRRRAFGWRQAVATVVGLGSVVAVFPALSLVLDGRWGLPTTDPVAAVVTLDGADAVGRTRTLWLGGADILPGRGVVVHDSVSMLVTAGVGPRLADLVPAASTRTTQSVRSALLDALRGPGPGRLGAVLARHSIRYLVIPSNVSAEAVAGQRSDITELRATLAQQLDLHALDVAPGVDAYEVDARVSPGGEPVQVAWMPALNIASLAAWASVVVGVLVIRRRRTRA